MNEDILNALRQKDAALRDAIRMEEQELPQMPADLNARLMKRMEQQKPTAKTRRLWSWVAAAASLLLLIGVGMTMMPKEEQKQPGELVVAEKVEKEAQQVNQLNHEDCPHDTSEAMDQRGCPRDSQPSQIPTQGTKQKTVVAELQTAEKTVVAEAVVAETTAPAESRTLTASRQPETLTDSDIPITRPENYHYTPEEIALMKRQANEAYLKWVELELEIAKYNQEQTAQK